MVRILSTARWVYSIGVQPRQRRYHKPLSPHRHRSTLRGALACTRTEHLPFCSSAPTAMQLPRSNVRAACSSDVNGSLSSHSPRSSTLHLSEKAEGRCRRGRSVDEIGGVPFPALWANGEASSPRWIPAWLCDKNGASGREQRIGRSVCCAALLVVVEPGSPLCCGCCERIPALRSCSHVASSSLRSTRLRAVR